MGPRRALAGLLAVGAAVMAAGSADALSWRRATCNEFRSAALDHDALVRARVARTWDLRAGEEQWTSEVEATVRESIAGRGLPRGIPIVYTARVSEISGVQFGFIPKEGDEVILYVNRGDDRRWSATSAVSAADFDRYWVPRCAF